MENTQKTVNNLILSVHSFNKNEERLESDKHELNQQAEKVISYYLENNNLDGFVTMYNKEIQLAIGLGDLGNKDSYIISSKTGKATTKLVTTHNAERIGRFQARALERLTADFPQQLTFKGSVSLSITDKNQAVKPPLIDQILNLIERHPDFKGITPDKDTENDVTFALLGLRNRHEIAEQELKEEMKQRQIEKDLKEHVHALEIAIHYGKKLGDDVSDKIDQLKTARVELENMAV